MLASLIPRQVKPWWKRSQQSLNARTSARDSECGPSPDWVVQSAFQIKLLKLQF